MDEIAFTYDEKKNPDGTWIDGVPLRHLTKAEFKALKPHLQAAVKREAYYVAVEKEAAKPAKDAKEAKGDKG